MKKILLIISLALLWSFNVNAQQTETKATMEKAAVSEKKVDVEELKKATETKEAIAIAQKAPAVELPTGNLRKSGDAVSNPNCRTRYTAQEALDSTADGNVNMFGAVYSGVTQRTCEEKLPENIQRAVSDKLISDKLIEAREAERAYEDIEERAYEDIEERAYEMPALKLSM